MRQIFTRLVTVLLLAKHLSLGLKSKSQMYVRKKNESYKLV